MVASVNRDMAMFSGVENCWRNPPAERAVLQSR